MPTAQVNLSDEELKRLSDEAKAENRSISNFIRTVVLRYLDGKQALVKSETEPEPEE